ncbi:MAG: response regulator [Candidatus Latescibacteria bacterium]|jgi:two-component system, OmpR family, response regulator|nr:response regulator [Candidatus Latescibacterota bacterium]MBT5829103.1 response regulator [Candidatus Latescibacterota bacterium]
MNKTPLNKKNAPQILIVDDEPEMRNMLTEVLTMYQCVPLEASKATEAMVHMEKYRVDLVLLDIHMQGASGVDLLKVMRRRHLKIPTIVISGFVTEELAAELALFGVAGIVAKPFMPTRIMEEISKIITIPPQIKDE